MSRFEDRLESHPTWSLLEELSKLARDAEQLINENSLDQTHLFEVTRIQDVLNYLDRSLSAADPSLVSEGSLNGISTQLEHARNHIRSYNNNQQIGQLQNANGRLDNALNQVPHLNTPKTAADLEGLREQLHGFRISAGMLTANLESDVRDAEQRAAEFEEHVKDKISEIEQTLEGELAQIREHAEQSREGISKDLSSELESVRSEIESHKEDVQRLKETFEESVTGFKQQFSDIQEKRRESFENNQEDRRTTFTNTIGAIEATGQGFIDRMEDYEEQVVKQMEVIGTTGMTGGFKKDAEYEREQADFWRKVTVWAMAAIIAVAIWTAGATIQASEFDLGRFASKAFLTAAIGLLAGYAGTQAAKHRHRERRAKQLELELSSIGPYLSALPEEDQVEVKVSLIKRWFGKDPDAELEGAITKQTLWDTLQDFFKWATRKSPE